jgi:uncharacterized damage-inducible protein DinB
MLSEILAELYERDLNKLKAEIEQYENEADIWKTAGEITNPAGALCLHIAGNLRHFFGSVLGGTDYERDRDAEFASRDVPRSDLLTGVDAALADVKATLSKLTSEDFDKTYPLEVFGKPMKTGWFLTHLTTHLNYHLGQINYHRRLVERSKA